MYSRFDLLKFNLDKTYTWVLDENYNVTFAGFEFAVEKKGFYILHRGVGWTGE